MNNLFSYTYGKRPDICDVYNAANARDSLPYRPLSREDADRLFYGEGSITLSAVDPSGKTAGFISARIPNEKGTSYLSYIGVLPEHHGGGIASELLDRCEARLRDEFGAKKIDIVFWNPVYLPWIIPGTEDGHPCAPGIKTDSPACRLLLTRGYSEWCAQIAYYMPLSEYRDSEKLIMRREKLAADGIVITFYDPGKHRGMNEIFDVIGNPGWRAGVMAHLDRPIVVAVDENRDGLIIGYTGPLTQTPEGRGIRGNFNGIGVDPAYRGRGIGTQIFCAMCRHHSEHGATFMSLYTGENNPARRVYEAAGCRGVVRWSNLRLILDEEV